MRVALCLLCALAGVSASAQPAGAGPDVLFQGFYWNVHPGDHADGDRGVWWDSLATVAPRLGAAGVESVWIPAPSKGMGGRWSMGYDLYDYYDLGSINQKGSTRTRFGSEAQLRRAVAAMKGEGMKLMVDVVLNHRFGADARSEAACFPGGTPFEEWNVFTPASGRFPADAASFHSNPTHCDFDAPYHDAPFGADLCFFHGTDNVLDAGAPNNGWFNGSHSLGAVGDSLVAFGRWLVDDLGADEVRLDAIKHIEPGFLAPWVTELASGGQPFALGEFWSGAGDILSYHAQVESFNTTFGGGTRDASMAMFDFPLRYALRDMANGGGGYNMWDLNTAGLHAAGLDAFDVVTFVENHDVDRVGWVWDDCTDPAAVRTGATCVKPGTDSGHDPITARKHMAYAVIMAAEGRPTVFWKDYLWYGLGDEIDWMMALRRLTAQGESRPLAQLNPASFNGADFWALRRDGFGSPRYGSVLALSDGAEEGAWVDSPHTGYELKDYSDAYAFETTTAYADGRAYVKARGGDYAWWAPTGLYPRPLDEPASAFALTAAPGGKLHHVVLRAQDAAALRVAGAPIQPGDQVAVLAPGAAVPPEATTADVAGIGRVGQRLRWDGAHDMVIEVLGNGASVGADASRLDDGDALRLVVFDGDTGRAYEAGTVSWASGGTFAYGPLRPATRGGAFTAAATRADGLYAAGAVSLVTGFQAGPSTPSIVLTGEAGWRALALPYPDLGLGGDDPASGGGPGGAVTPGLLQPLYTAGYAGADIDEDNSGGFANVFTYREGDGTYPVPPTSTSVPHGRGFWYYLFEDEDPFTNGTQGAMPKVLAATGTPLAADHDFGVTYTPGAPSPGTHLLGNPYDQNLSWDHPGWTKTRVASTVYVWDPGYNGGDYRAWTTGVGGTLANGEIPVGQAFFAYATGPNPSLIAPAAARTGEWMPVNGKGSAPEAAIPHVRLALASGERTATLAVALHPDAEAGLDPRDAIALAPHSPEAVRLTAGGADGWALAVAAVPGEAEVPVQAEVLGATGDAPVTLAWEPVAMPEGWTAEMVDRRTGTTYRLDAPGQTTLTLHAEDGALVAPPAPADAAKASGVRAGAPRFERLRVEGASRFTVVLRRGVSTGADEAEARPLALGAPAPNPARGAVRLPFTLDAAREVRLSVTDALGREVAVLARGPLAAGDHERALETARLAPGVYVVRLAAGAEVRTRRLTVVR